MPDYAGSSYIGSYTPPRSFKDDEVSPEMQAWAEKTGKVKPGGTRSGSVFMETVDEQGRPTYIARTLDQMDGWSPDKAAGGATLGRIKGTEDKDGRLLSFKVSKDKWGNDIITKDREYGPSKLTRRQADEYAGEFQRYKYKAEEQERLAREEAKRIAEENRKADIAEKSKDNDVKRAVGVRRELAAVDREIAQSDPGYESRRALENKELQARLDRIEAENAARKWEADRAASERTKIDAAQSSARAYQARSNAGRIVYKEVLDQTGDPVAARAAAVEADTEAFKRGAEARVSSFTDELADFNKRDATYFGSDPTSDEVEDLVGKASILRNYYRDNLRMDPVEAGQAVLAAFRAASRVARGDDMAAILERRLRETLGSE